MLCQRWVALFHREMECLLIAVVQFKWQHVLVNVLYRQQYQVNLGRMFEKVNVIAVNEGFCKKIILKNFVMVLDLKTLKRRISISFCFA